MNLTDFYKISMPIAPLVGAGLGAVGGAVTAPKGHRMSGALGGAAAGALTGGVGKKLIGKFKGIKPGKTTIDEAAKGALVNTGASALATKLTSDKHPLVRNAAPFLDDAVALGLMAAKGV